MKVYQAYKNNKHYWFIAKSKTPIIKEYGFLKSSDIALREDVKPEDYFRVVN